MEAVFVGSRGVRADDPVRNVSFPVLTMYPTETPSGPVAFGPYSIDLAPDAPVRGGPLPLVVISHGGGSSPLVHRALASHLATLGYLVALPEHPGNNRNDNSREGTRENLEDRPRHVRLAIDAVSADAWFRDRADPDRVAIVGHSMGGYTALAVAGGQPWYAIDRKIDVARDPRVKALVLMAPATGWYAPNDALEGVTVPILLLAAERDPVTPRWQAQLVLDLVPDPGRVTFKLVENAGHFSFLTPFPPALKRAGFPPSVDPEGFDREAFSGRLAHEVGAFLGEALNVR